MAIPQNYLDRLLERFPEIGQLLVSIIVSTTVIFELFGPTVTRWRLSRAQETQEAKPITQSDDLPREKT